MKRKILVSLSLFFILLGTFFLLFVLWMVWFPPESMGMMMGREMMLHHMYYWFGQMFWLSLIFFGIVLLIWTFWSNRKEDN